MKELDFNPDKDIFKSGTGTKTGRGHRPLLEKEILDAQEIARSAAEAARILNVSYNTYKKYAKKYDIFENLLNPSGVGISQTPSATRNKYSLDDLIKGKHPDYPVWKLKDRLIKSGYLPEKCDNCGFDERRVSDYRVPVILDFIDGDRRNHKYENLRFLCYNCFYLLNGNIMGKKKLYYF